MNAVHLTLPDYMVVVGYFLIVLWIGFYFRATISGASDYFAGGHQVPWWMAGISHYMSSFSAFSFVAYAQIGYTYGWVAITLFWVAVPACILGGLIFAERWRRARIITPVQFLEDRFSATVRQLFAWAGIPMKIFDDALKIFATGLFLSVSVGFSLHWAILACGVVMIAYTFLGGLWALVVTDFVQFVMKVLAMFLLLPLALWKVGGFSVGFKDLPEHFLAPIGGPYGWLYVVGFTVLMAISYNGTWALAQKYYSVPDETSAKRASYLAAALNFVGAPIMILPAVLGRKLLPNLIAHNHTADTYVLLVMELLPVGMIGIIIAAMFSATMASVSADFNAVASVLTQDIYCRLFNPNAPQRVLVRMGRLITLFLGGLTIALSIWIAVAQSQSLFHMMVTVFGLLMAPTLLPLLAGLTVRRLTTRGALTGFAAGLIFGIATFAVKTWYLPHARVSQEWASYTFEGISILINTVATVLGMVIGTILFPAGEQEDKKVQSFFDALDKPIKTVEISANRISFHRPLGVSTIGVGFLLICAGFLSQSGFATVIDVPIGAGLLLLGAACSRRAKTSKDAKAAIVEQIQW